MSPYSLELLLFYTFFLLIHKHIVYEILVYSIAVTPAMAVAARPHVEEGRFFFAWDVFDFLPLLQDHLSPILLNSCDVCSGCGSCGTCSGGYVFIPRVFYA